MSASFDVIVVGGGFAGLTAARDLRHAGRSVCLLEGRDRLGGRTRVDTFPGLDQAIELGGTWVCPGDQENITREMGRYGIGYVQSPTPNTYHWLTGGMLRTGMPVPLEELHGLESLLVHTMNSARRIRFGQTLNDPGLTDLDISVERFVEPFALGPAARDLAYAWAGLNSGADPSQYSTLNFLEWLAGWHDSVFLSFAALTNKIAGGTRTLVDALLVEGDPEVRLDTTVTSIDDRGDEVVVTLADGGEVRADAAVVSVPLNVLRNIAFPHELSAAKQAAIAAGHVGHSVKVWALVEDAPKGLAACGWGAGLAWLSSEYVLPEGQLMVGFGTDPRMLAHDITSVQAAVEALCPAAQVLAVAGHDWNADPFSLGTWTAYRAGEAGLAAALRTPEGRIAFATADAARRWVGFIEGGLEMGAEAAQAVVSARPTPRAVDRSY